MSLALALTLLAAALSCHYVEEPAMRRRRKAVRWVEGTVSQLGARLRAAFLGFLGRLRGQRG